MFCLHMRNYLKKRLFQFIGHDSPLGKRLAKNSFIGIFGSLSDSGMGVVRTALLAKTMALDDFGKVYIIINFYAMLNTFFSVRVNDVLFRFLPQFQNEKNETASNALISLCLSTSLSLGLVLFLCTFFLSPWISVSFYHDVSLIPAFRIYSLVLLFNCFDGFCTAILRLQDRFTLLIAPRIIGSFINLLFIAIYLFLHAEDYKIEYIMLAFFMGAMIRSFLPLVFALNLQKAWKRFVIKKAEMISLKPYRSLILSNFFHTNLVGYLKIASDTGGLFLLGILAAPSQVAFYNIAKQITQPLKLLKDNIQSAFTPEIMKLWAMKKFSVLYSLIKKYERFSLIVGGSFILVLLIFVKPILLIISTKAYFDAIPTMIVLVFALYLNFAFTLFYPLTVVMDKMSKRNAIVSLRLLYLAIGMGVGLNAFSLALVHLVGVLTVRLFSDLPLFVNFKRNYCCLK